MDSDYNALFKAPIDTIFKKEPSWSSDEKNLQMADRITSILKNFGIDVLNVESFNGPAVSYYELSLSNNNQAAEILELEEDLRFSLGSEKVRIINLNKDFPSIGLEIGNNTINNLTLGKVMASLNTTTLRADLPIALGLDNRNTPYLLDLRKAKHILVTGRLSTGKTNCLNMVLASLLCGKDPDELQVMLVDPNKVEFLGYTKIKDQYLCAPSDKSSPIFDEPDKAYSGLQSLCAEMERRLHLIDDSHLQTIEEYNEKGEKGAICGFQRLPYIVVVIDELSDLLLDGDVELGNTFTTPLIELLKRGHNVGIHVVASSQNPMPEELSEFYKENFPTRICLRVNTSEDSSVLIDIPDACRLSEPGDMIVYDGLVADRVQGAFLSSENIANLSDYISMHPKRSGSLIL